MKPHELQKSLETLFGVSHTPGQAFDVLVAMRKDGVTLEQVRLFLCDSITQTELALSTPVGQMDEFTEHSLMPFGKHKGTPICKLPGEYLAWLYRQGDELSHKPLAKFIANYKRAKACDYVAKEERAFGGYDEDGQEQERYD